MGTCLSFPIRDIHSPPIGKFELLIFVTSLSAKDFFFVEFVVLDFLFVLRVPENVISRAIERIGLESTRSRIRNHADTVLRTKDLVKEKTHAVDILHRDLDEDGAARREKLAHKNKAVTKVGEVTVDAPLPSVAEGRNHARFGGHVFVLAVLYVALMDGGHKVGAELDAVGRVHVDALYLSGQPFVLEQGVHHQKGIARNHTVRPLHGMVVGIDLFRAETATVGLRLLKHLLLNIALPVVFEGGLEDAHRVHGLVLVDGEGRHLHHVLALVEPL